MAEALPFISIGALIACVAAFAVATFALQRVRGAVKLTEEAVKRMKENVRFSRWSHPSVAVLDEEYRRRREERKQENR